jgi:hypothetical protein
VLVCSSLFNLQGTRSRPLGKRLSGGTGVTILAQARFVNTFFDFFLALFKQLKTTST